MLSDKLSETERRRTECQDILVENDKKTKEYVKNLGSCKSVDRLYNNNKCLTEFNQQNTIQNSSNNKQSFSDLFATRDELYKELDYVLKKKKEFY